MKWIFQVFLVTVFLTILPAMKYVNGQSGRGVNITINESNVIHQMKGGIGASWHAMISEIPLENEKYDYPVRHINPRGSTFAGNPPLDDTSAWNQLYRHARWLGLDFIRVEIAQQMYEPERNVFDWDNAEMKALYRILDWCEKNQADVFLQQMWSHVAWNAHDGVHPLLSSPKSLDDFGNGIVTLLKYLTENRKYTCIKYFCMTNEPPGGTWGYWWCSGSHTGPSLTDAWKKLSKSIKSENINIILSGPDWTSLPPFDPAKMDFSGYLGSFDIHSYGGIYHTGNGEEIIRDWVNFAKTENKPFFLSEIGNMSVGWGADNPGPKSFKASLSNASDIVLCMNLGVDGFNRWSFTNRGDMDGQWQLVRTYNLQTRQYEKNIIPEKEAYYGYAMLTRFLGKYASVLESKADNNPDSLVFASCKNTDGNLSVLFVNNRKEPVTVSITFENSGSRKDFRFYQVTESLLHNPDFRLDPQKLFRHSNKLKNLVLQPESISVLTNIDLVHSDPGVIR